MATGESKLFIEWSHKVLEELSTLNARFESLDEKHDMLRDSFAERVAQLDRKLEKVNEILLGNGDTSKSIVMRLSTVEAKNVANLDVRVDRLEQSESRRTWLLRASIVACLGCIGATIVSWIKNWH